MIAKLFFCHCLKLVVFLWLLCLSQFCSASAQFIFGVNAPGSPPYLYLTKNSLSYHGVIPDVLNKLKLQYGYRIKYVDSFHTRTELLIYNGKIDGFLSSVHWLEFPQRLIATEPVVEHRSYLYSTRPFTENFTLEHDPVYRICARRGYTYPALTPYFASGKTARVDSSSQLSMLNMLKINRCDMAVMHEFNAMAILNAKEFINNQIYQSSSPTDVVDLSIFLRPDLVELKVLLDNIITEMKETGELEKSLQHHIAEAL